MNDIPKSFRQWVVAKPQTGGHVRLDQFAQREVPTPELADGQALVRVKLLNLHSRTRLRMPTEARPSGYGVTSLGDTDRSNYACVEVVASKDRTFRVGDIIACQAGWQEYQVISSEDESVGYGAANEILRAVNGTNAQMNYVFRPEMVKSWSPEILMDVFGTSGMTAYFGMRECGPIMPRDKVLVAGASGSVGSMAAQLAKARGAYVVGLAGGAARCDWTKETLGIDACIDYQSADFHAQLRGAFPQGIDVFSDGVGGELTEKVIEVMNQNGRLFAYGASAAFYSKELRTETFTSLREAFGVSERIDQLAGRKNINIECWIVYEFYHERIAAENELSRLLRAGVLKPITNVTAGFENLPKAVIGLYDGPHAGKAQVRF